MFIAQRYGTPNVVSDTIVCGRDPDVRTAKRRRSDRRGRCAKRCLLSRPWPRPRAAPSACQGRPAATCGCLVVEPPRNGALPRRGGVNELVRDLRGTVRATGAPGHQHRGHVTFDIRNRGSSTMAPIGVILNLRSHHQAMISNLVLAVQWPCIQRTRSHSWTIGPVLVELPDVRQVAADLRLQNIFRAFHRIPEMLPQFL
jgi:hypothetical protein